MDKLKASFMKRLFSPKELIQACAEDMINVKNDPLYLMGVVKERYESSFIRNKPHHVFAWKMLHLYYMKMARHEGLDVSKYHEELNYLEMQN